MSEPTSILRFTTVDAANKILHSVDVDYQDGMATIDEAVTQAHEISASEIAAGRTTITYIIDPDTSHAWMSIVMAPDSPLFITALSPEGSFVGRALGLVEGVNDLRGEDET